METQIEKLNKEVKALQTEARRLDKMREGFVSCSDEHFELVQERFENWVETAAQSFKVSPDEIMFLVNG